MTTRQRIDTLIADLKAQEASLVRSMADANATFMAVRAHRIKLEDLLDADFENETPQ
jgi:hypothetical protein